MWQPNRNETLVMTFAVEWVRSTRVCLFEYCKNTPMTFVTGRTPVRTLRLTLLLITFVRLGQEDFVVSITNFTCRRLRAVSTGIWVTAENQKLSIEKLQNTRCKTLNVTLFVCDLYWNYQIISKYNIIVDLFILSYYLSVVHFLYFQ